jgi:glycosyltransferase involved in cell wall biosynthesis
VTFRQEWFERVVLPLDVRHVAGPRRVRCGTNEMLVVCLLRDAEYHIRPFIEHYQTLGVRHIVLLDNGSTDATIERASAFQSVSVFRTALPFKGNNRQMRRYLVRRFAGLDRWVLVVDVDELFDYPWSDRVDLASLAGYLRSNEFTAMAGYLLDMLPESPLAAVEPGRPMKDAFPCYDISAVRKLGYFEADAYHGERWVSHNTVPNPDIKRYVGGIRAQAFDLPDVYLTKHPLILNNGRTDLVHQHFVDHAAVADISGVLYHYKFAPGFREKVDAAVRAGQYAQDSWEYKRYQGVLARDPNLSFKTDTSRTLGSVNDLVAEGFLQVTDNYRRWVERHA